MAEKWPKIAQKLPKIAHNGPKMTQNCQNGPKITQNGPKISTSWKKIAQIYLQDLQLFASLTTPRREIEKAGVRCAAEREKDITGGNQTFHIFLGPFKANFGDRGLICQDHRKGDTEMIFN